MGLCGEHAFAPAELNVPGARDGICYGTDILQRYLPGIAGFLGSVPNPRRNVTVWSAYCLLRAIINAVNRPSGEIQCFVVRGPWKYHLPPNLELKQLELSLGGTCK